MQVTSASLGAIDGHKKGKSYLAAISQAAQGAAGCRVLHAVLVSKVVAREVSLLYQTGARCGRVGKVSKVGQIAIILTVNSLH